MRTLTELKQPKFTYDLPADLDFSESRRVKVKDVEFEDKVNSIYLTADFNLQVEVKKCSGDYYTPPYASSTITDIDICNLNIYEFDGSDIEVSDKVFNKIFDYLNLIIAKEYN